MFWIYRNLKTKFLNLFGRATTPRCLNFIPISCMGHKNLPEDTHVIFQPTLVHWSMCLYFKFELCTQRWHVPSQNHEPYWEKLRFARNLYQNLFLFCIFLPQLGTTMTWHHAKFHDFKTKFLNVLDRATMPRCLNFILIFCMGPRNSPEDTNVIFELTLVNGSMCL